MACASANCPFTSSVDEGIAAATDAAAPEAAPVAALATDEGVLKVAGLCAEFTASPKFLLPSGRDSGFETGPDDATAECAGVVIAEAGELYAGGSSS